MVVAACVLSIAPLNAQPFLDEGQSIALLTAFTDRGSECGLLLPWEAETLRAITADARRNWDGEEARVLADTAALAAATSCEDTLLVDYIDASRGNLEAEYLSLFLVAYRTLVEFGPPPEPVAGLLHRTDAPADVRTIGAKIAALEASGARPEGGGPWPAFVARTAAGVHELVALLDGAGPEREEAWFWIGASVRVAELWLANEDAAALCGPGTGPSVHLAGTLVAGDRLAYRFGPGLSFELRPTPAGWEIAVTDTAGIDRSAITPPVHPAETNPRQIAGWHFRNADNTGPNQGDVNAPQTVRSFAFALDRETALAGPVDPGAAGIGHGVLAIQDYGLADLAAGERARMVHLQFGACLDWPATAGEVYSGIYRRGFEQSAFYTDDGRGPFWLEADEAATAQFLAFETEGESRGASVTLRMRVVATLQPFDPTLTPIVGPHEARLVVSELLAIEPISDEAFQAEVRAIGGMTPTQPVRP
ncbi:MAG: hypothetical protein KIS68_03460 [Bauldia sp.]|nr:hypothetical protein [Bauldia sp.]